eukprot:TRINITY_DN4374_c0_g2_i1.p1 TRINITY_DN4374_c0_g2~~TRINITY_DN4374_c0_g2_i1.p1  ORF type:complete len:203 (+),score=30.86 TRINITY_DN4374_c0_g2_i1:233-841(+)
MHAAGRIVRKVVSGGQTGVDRAALDAAFALQLPMGGWCPKGRRAEDGSIDSKYPLVETPTRNYKQRTEWNVRDSDATLILVWKVMQKGGGTELTAKFAEKHRKPFLVVDISTGYSPSSAATLDGFLDEHAVEVLNVAGPRESDTVPVYESSLGYLTSHLRGTVSSGTRDDETDAPAASKPERKRVLSEDHHEVEIEHKRQRA